MKIRFKLPAFDIRKSLSRLHAKTNGKATEALMWIGTGFVIGGTVWACKKTMELPEILEAHRTEKADILAATVQADEKGSSEENTKRFRRRELRNLRLRTTGKVAKLYALPATMEAIGLADMFGSHTALKAVNTELTGTVAVLSTAIERIRAGIREEGGEELEEKIMHGGYEEQEVVRVDENGEEHAETLKVYKAGAMPSPYARWFCFGEADAAEESDDYNETFLTHQQAFLPSYLRANRKVFLNDVYRMLGIRESVAGNHVGWVYDPEAPSGDNTIDLRIQKVCREKEGHPGEWETVFLIDPNVDGEIEAKALRLGYLDA